MIKLTNEERLKLLDQLINEASVYNNQYKTCLAKPHNLDCQQYDVAKMELHYKKNLIVLEALKNYKSLISYNGDEQPEWEKHTDWENMFLND